jgi:hypothetical protein
VQKTGGWKVDDYELDTTDLEAWARRAYQDHASDLDDLDGYLVEDEDFPSDQELEAEIEAGICVLKDCLAELGRKRGKVIQCEAKRAELSEELVLQARRLALLIHRRGGQAG